MLNFSTLKWLGKVAVHCATEQDAQTLVNEMWAQHPELMNCWRRGETKWDWYKKDTCYAPHIYDGGVSCLQFCHSIYWVKEGYTIVPFEELLMPITDLGEIQADESYLSVLFN